MSTEAEASCLTHDAPHQSGGRCTVYRAVEDVAVQAYTTTREWRLPDDLEQCAWPTGRWLEPHAGVTGVERTEDDLLDLSAEALARRKIMLVIARAFHDAVMVGNPAPKVARMYERFGRDKVQPGDLVVEATALYGYDEDRECQGFGILLEHREEWASTLAEWNEVIDEERRAHEESTYSHGPFDPASVDPRGTNHAWYVQYGSAAGDVCRWTNCSFVALPIDAATLADRSFGTRDGTGVTITRSDLVGSLADSGFALRAAASKGTEQ